MSWAPVKSFVCKLFMTYGMKLMEPGADDDGGHRKEM